MSTLSVFNPRFTSDLFDSMDRSIADYFPAITGETRIHMPKVDVREMEKSYVLEMDLPGFAESDVEISLKDRVLSISSKKEEKNEEKKNGEWLIRERRAMTFARRFTLPDDIDGEGVSAHFENGVLTVDIPRKPESQNRTIAISAKK